MQPTDICKGIDSRADRHGLSASGLARRAGLDPTAFNKSKRVTAGGALVYRRGDRIVVALGGPVRRGDRMVVRAKDGEVLVKVLGRKFEQLIELTSLDPA